jgi:peptidoglycan/LPS O-acetylase OafA/YrhL
MLSVRRIPSLDGLRAISISLVVLGHLAKTGHTPRIFWSYYAGTGVCIFFVISGFLISTILLQEHERTSTINLRQFYIRRAYRIFPAAFFFMAVAFIAYWPQFRWYHMLAGVLYVANFDPWRPWIFGHLWSLSVEEQFYFLWPSVLKRWYRYRLRILLAVMVLAPIGQALLYFFKVQGGNIGAFPGVAANLAAGCLLAMVFPRMPKISGWLALVMSLAIVAVPVFDANTPVRTLFMTFVLQPVFYLSIAGVILHVVQVPYWFLNWAPITFLGRISYSLYLWQQPFCADPQLRSGILVVFSIAMACLSYYYVELPMLRKRDGSKVEAMPVKEASLLSTAS